MTRSAADNHSGTPASTPLSAFASTSAHGLAGLLADRIDAFDREHEDYIPRLADAILAVGRSVRASDIHLVPAADVLRVAFRIDGVLHDVARFDSAVGQRLVSRLKVLSGLLTYRTEVPQEGRIRRGTPEFAGRNSAAAASTDAELPPDSSETRVSTFPTLFGEKAVIRLFASAGRYESLWTLGLSDDVCAGLDRSLAATSGVILVTGPAGSGKTTTAYACLRDILRNTAAGRSVTTLEDPIEMVIPGASQSQVRASAGFDLLTGLRSLMRQDPDVIFVGEIRDAETARVAFQAALTGHLVLTTFHSGHAIEAVTRLIEMGIESYVLKSTLVAVMSQRLLRASCEQCAVSHRVTAEQTKSASNAIHAGSACEQCGGTSYCGRLAVSELICPAVDAWSQNVLASGSSREMLRVACEAGFRSIHQRALEAVNQGRTTKAEVFRVLGPSAE